MGHELVELFGVRPDSAPLHVDTLSVSEEQKPTELIGAFLAGLPP